MTTKAQTEGLGEFARLAFTLEHLDNHLVLLLHEGEQVATFSQTGATEDSLQQECARHLFTCHGWDGRK